MYDADDYPHQIGTEPNFSESMYFHFADTASGLNGFLRLANRPNEGRGERTVCIFLQDGRVAFSFARPRFANPLDFRAGGLAVEIEEPFTRHRVTYDGDAHLLADPSLMSDPKTALSTSPTVPVQAELAFRAASGTWADSLDKEMEFVANHYEQFMTVTGTVEVGGQSFEIDGRGVRDHSWGPRSWQAPYFYRWIHGSRDGFGFAAGILGKRDAPTGMGGFVWEGTEVHALDEVHIRTTWAQGSDDDMRTIKLVATAGDRTWSLAGTVDNAVPLRNRTEAGTTRILENALRWSHEGHEMLGVAEYLDQVVDGVPVGNDAYDR